ncbi:MAG: glycosyltransferase [Vicinamibacterales bacterium]
MDVPRIVIAVPCYNEAHRLRPAAFVEALADWPGLSLVFVEDGSTDGTRNLLKQLVDTCGPAASVLPLDCNHGKAEAVRQGILLAFEQSPDFVGYWDADLATPLDALGDFLAVFEKRPEVDIVMGSRAQLLGRRIDRDPLRHYFGRLFATAAALALGIPVYDTQCGAKLFRSCERTLEPFARPFETRWTFDVELLARYLDLEGDSGSGESRLYEVALRHWNDVPGSKVRPWDLPRGLFELWGIHRGRSRSDRQGVRRADVVMKGQAASDRMPQ